MSKKSEFSNAVWPFYPISGAVFKLLRKFKIGENYFNRLKDKLKIIYPKYGDEEILEQYITSKIMNVLIFLSAAIILFLVYITIVKEDNVISKLQRNDYWGEDEVQTITVKTDLAESEMDIDVLHRQLSEEEIDKIINEAIDKLPGLIVGDNKSLDEISSDLNLISTIPGTNIDVYWEIEENNVVNEDGTVILENLNKDGMLVKFTATLSYEDYMVSTEFYGNFVCPELTEEQLLELKLKEKIRQINESTVSEESLVLPVKIENNKITYTTGEKDLSKITFMIMIVICIPLIFFAQDEKLEKERIKRQTQMLVDYPEIVNKLILYIGAGLTIQGSFEMIVNNYLNDKKKGKHRAAYEELVFMYREIHGGVSFRNAIENLSGRCKVQAYRKLSMILLQNLRKGSSELIGLLRQEAAGAFDERKNMARRLGEEAGTKMLFPMIVMLGIVIVILIVPAFMSFQM